MSMGEKIVVPSKDVQAQVYEMLEQADGMRQEKNFDDALSKYQEILDILNENPWPQKEDQIHEEMEETQQKKQEYLEKLEKQKKFEQAELQRNEREQQQAKERENARQKQLSATEQKKQALAEKKMQERRTSEQAYDLLGRGTDAAEKNDYETAIQNYQEALDLFQDISWATEVQRTQEMLEEIAKKKDQYEQSQQARLAKEEELEQIKEREFAKEQKLQSRLKQKEAAVKTKQEESSKLKKSQEELSEMAFALIDEGNRLKNEEKDYETAIAKYKEAQNIFKDIKWEGEAQKVLAEIGRLKEEWQKYKKQQEWEEKKRQKQETEQEQSQQEDEERENLRKKQAEQRRLVELKKKEAAESQEEASQTAFRLIEEAENLAKDYDSAKKAGEYPTYPYEDIMTKYAEAKVLFTEAGWQTDADKLNTSMAHHRKRKEQEAKWLQLQEQKRQNQEEAREQEKREEAARGKLRKKEEEQKRLAELKKKVNAESQEEASNLAFKLIEEAENLAKEYDSAKKAGEYPTYPYEDIIAKYTEAKKLFTDAGWQTEADKLTASIAHHRKMREQEGKWLQLQEQKRQKQEEAREQERREDKARENLRKKEEQHKKLAEMKKKEDEDYQQEASNWAFKLIEEAENLAKDYDSAKRAGQFPTYPFDEIMEKYLEAKKTFLEAGWQADADKLATSMAHHRKMKEQEAKWLQLQQSKQQRLQEEEQEIDALARANQRELEQKRRKEQEKHEAELTKKQRSDETITQGVQLADDASKALEEHRYEDAIEIYRQIEQIYEEIEWAEGVENIREAIRDARGKEKKYNAEQERLRALEEKRQQEEEEVESQVRLSEKEKQEKARKEKISLDERQKRQQAKEEAQNQVYAKLEEANNLVENEGFDDAVALVQEALELFPNIEDPIQEGQVRDLIQDIRRKKAESLRRQEIQEKRQKGRLESEREQDEMIRKSEEERRQRDEEERAKANERIQVQKELADLSSQAYAILDRADVLFTQGKNTQGINKLKEVQDLFEQLGWEKELTSLRKRIAQEQQKYDQEQERKKLFEKAASEKEISDKAYQVLDSAEAQFKRGKFQLGMDKLEEALAYFKELGWDKEITALEQRMTQERDKVEQEHARMRELEKTQQDKELADKAYVLIDQADELFRRSKTNLGLQKLDESLECFTQLGWEKEIQGVQKRMEEEQKKVEFALQKRKIEAKNAQERERGDQAFILLDEGENNMRKRRLLPAVEKYESAAQIFEELGWQRELKQVQTHIAKLRKQIDEEEQAREEVKRKAEQRTSSPEYAFELLDESEKLFRNRKIDEAIAKALEVKSIFESNGWDKESQQVDVFIATLEDEKQKRDERQAEAQKVREQKLEKEADEEEEKQRLIEERRKQRMQDRAKRRE